jgi:hypothetical protein
MRELAFKDKRLAFIRNLAFNIRHSKWQSSKIKNTSMIQAERQQSVPLDPLIFTTNKPLIALQALKSP